MTKDKLAVALQEEGFTQLADKAYAGHYNDEGPLDAPVAELVNDLQQVGTHEAHLLIERVRAGEFDSDVQAKPERS